MSHKDDLYDTHCLALFEAIWGEGYLSPGGEHEIKKLLEGININDKAVLDIGCGSGGITLSLAQDFGAKQVIGIDVEKTVCESAQGRVDAAGYSEHVQIDLVSPGPLPFADQQFDIVFSKDAIIHIADKESLAKDVYQVLKPSGWFVASDWLISHDHEPSEEMKRYIELEGLEFEMASPDRYQQALKNAGFVNVSLLNRNQWYFKIASAELEQLEFSRRDELEAKVGAEFLDKNIQIWKAMTTVLQSGEHCPHHFRAQKPSA